MVVATDVEKARVNQKEKIPFLVKIIRTNEK